MQIIKDVSRMRHSHKMSEEIIQKGYENQGLQVEKYQFYNLGSTTISTLKKYKIILNKDYKEYEKKKPDALLVNRRNKSKPSVVAVIEHKSPEEFKTKKQQKEAVEQANNYAQVLKAKIGIATDKSTFIWFNPNHKNPDTDSSDDQIDNLKHELKQFQHNLKLAKYLKNMILKKAFEGKLVPQDPNDESVEILLQKMKLEKEQLKQKEKSKKEKKIGR